jgi:cytoskeleton protein RodZ
MELFGEKLREVRESKKYTIEQVARETRISRRYIEALEKEDFSAFPGETYLIGFLRSYAEYLDLDPDHFINLYRNIKIQEQPIPFDELLDNKRKFPPILILVGIAFLVILIGAGIVFLSLNVFTKKDTQEIVETKTEEIVPETGKGEEFVFDTEVITKWFKEGDSIAMPLSDNIYRIEILKVEEPLHLKVFEKTTLLFIGKEVSFDLNDDKKLDITLMYNDLMAVDSGNQANLGLYKITVSKPVYVAEEIEEIPEQGQKDIAAVTESVIQPTPVPTATPVTEEERVKATPLPVVEVTEEIVLSEEEQQPAMEQEAETTIRVVEDTITVIQESEKRDPFSVHIDFRGYCLLRYFIDEKTKDERFFRKGEVLKLDNIKNEVKLSISNASSVKAKIMGKELIMGRTGQVVTKLIHWAKNEESGLYQLEIVSLY